ncbi:hypothetical protein ES708_12727 [subsurface metagenome]
MNTKVRAVLNGILETFKSGDLPKAIAYSLFPYPDIPSSSWSFQNRFIMLISGTRDARGIRQWNKTGRHVLPGAKAIYILVPRIVKAHRLDDDEESTAVRGYLARPVFRVEDTQGEPLDYEKEIPVPAFPLLDKAREWGITVSSMYATSRVLGAYSQADKEILVATPEEIVFFHELSHAAHERVKGELDEGQHWRQEVVAELSAQALCHMAGRKNSSTMGNSYRYIERYAEKAGITAVTACLKVIGDVEKVLMLILENNQNEEEYEHVECAIEGTA